MLASDLLIFTVAIIGTLFATDVSIKGLKGVAKELHISELFIGLTIAAIGTSLPEIAVNIKAGLAGAGTIVTGNIIGSNISNITLLLGVCGLLTHFYMKKRVLHREGVMLVTSILIMTIALSDLTITVLEGVLLIAIYFLWISYILWDDKIILKMNHRKKKIKKLKLTIYTATLLLGFILLGIAANYVVESATSIATTLNISQYLIAVFLIGIGSSLPELILSLQSIIKGHRALSIGTLVGSNITNPLLPLGIGSIFGTATIAKDVLFIDIPFLITATFIAIIFLYSRYPGEPDKHEGLTKQHAAILLTLFLIYAITKLTLLLL